MDISGRRESLIKGISPFSEIEMKTSLPRVQGARIASPLFRHETSLVFIRRRILFYLFEWFSDAYHSKRTK